MDDTYQLLIEETGNYVRHYDVARYGLIAFFVGSSCLLMKENWGKFSPTPAIASAGLMLVGFCLFTAITSMKHEAMSMQVEFANHLLSRSEQPAGPAYLLEHTSLKSDSAWWIALVGVVFHLILCVCWWRKDRNTRDS